MTPLLQIFILIPLIGALLSVLCSPKKEVLISRVAFSTVGIQMLAFLTFVVFWLFDGHQALNLRDFVLFHITGYQFFIDFYFDKITAVYMFVGSVIIFLITIYSRYYLHREKGYKRYFNTVLFFYLGYNIVVLSGNLETLFIGWEILGVSSFLLIAFYRDRYLPVKNAVKVFSVYRLGDVGIILAMWASHHLWHENITFSKLSHYQLVHEHLQSHTAIGVTISLMILISAAAKSAQLPFSSWLPRAMEGPTPSSAIFYGSLSVHIGVFLLLRTFPFWEHQLTVRILIGVLGLVTSIVASGIARVQSSVKAQVAYASIAQIGLIFIEVAAGFENLALIHFAGNAFLRTYQVLVSPSVVSYLIREQFYNFSPRKITIEDSLPKRIENTLYMLCMKEWNLDSFMYRFLWNPVKKAGKILNLITDVRSLFFFVPLYLVGLYYAYHQEVIPTQVQDCLPYFFSIIGLLMVLKSFTERMNAGTSWILVTASHFWIALGIAFNEYFKFDQVHLYLSGIVVSGILGLLCLLKLKSFGNDTDLNQFHGHSYKHPKLAFVFLLACLGVTGFPITPTFIGEDLLFSHIKNEQVILAFIISLSFVIDGISIIRIYARIFLGPHVKSQYEMAYRSS